MSESDQTCVTATEEVIRQVDKIVKQRGVRFTLESNPQNLYARYLTQSILAFIVRGVYQTKILPSNELGDLFVSALHAPDLSKMRKIKEGLRKLYLNDLIKYSRINVAALVMNSLKQNTDIVGTVKGYFLLVSDQTINEVVKMVKGGLD